MTKPFINSKLDIRATMLLKIKDDFLKATMLLKTIRLNIWRDEPSCRVTIVSTQFVDATLVAMEV